MGVYNHAPGLQKVEILQSFDIPHTAVCHINITVFRDICNFLFFLEALSLIAFKSEPSLCLAVYSTCQWFWTRWRFLSISSIQWKICLHRKNRSACLVARGALKWKPWPNLRAAYSSRNGGLIMDIHSCCGLSVWKIQLVYALNFSDGEFTEMKRKQNNKSLDNIIWHFWIIHFLI